MARFRDKHDYIEHPKEDGYRSIHLVYEYQSSDDRRSIYNGNRIEIQIRSHMQHVWAAAVETVDTFTKQSLKSGIGHNSWKRFFAVTASFISAYEARSIGLPAPPEITDTVIDLVEDFNSLSAELKVKETLSHLVVATESLQSVPSKERAGWEFYIFLLKLKAPEDTSILGFKNNVDASEKYIELEKEHIGDPFTQLVLVSGDSVAALRRAYPNYFNDSADFINVLEQLNSAWEQMSGRISKFRRDFPRTRGS
jgi:hypothetical protein